MSLILQKPTTDLIGHTYHNTHVFWYNSTSYNHIVKLFPKASVWVEDFQYRVAPSSLNAPINPLCFCPVKYLSYISLCTKQTNKDALNKLKQWITHRKRTWKLVLKTILTHQQCNSAEEDKYHIRRLTVRQIQICLRSSPRNK